MLPNASALPASFIVPSPPQAITRAMPAATAAPRQIAGVSWVLGDLDAARDTQLVEDASDQRRAASAATLWIAAARPRLRVDDHERCVACGHLASELPTSAL